MEVYNTSLNVVFDIIFRHTYNFSIPFIVQPQANNIGNVCMLQKIIVFG